MTQDHLSDADLAALVDGALGEGRNAARAHLAECPRCMSAYAELVRIGTEWAGRSAAPLPRPQARRRRRALLVPVALAAAAIVVVGVVRLATRPPEPPPLLPGAELLAAVQRYSTVGLALVPVRVPQNAPAYRSPALADEDAVLDAVAELDRRYADAPSPDLAFWRAAGLLAAGQSRAAAAVVAEALVRFPDSGPVLIAAAAAAYQNDDVTRAEELLARVRPDDAVAALARKNLEIVRGEAGRTHVAPVPRDVTSAPDST